MKLAADPHPATMIRRIVVVVAAVALLPAFAEAQRFGFIAGASESSFDIMNDTCSGRDVACGYSYHYGGHSAVFGGFARFELKRTLAFEPEVLFTSKGSGSGHSPELHLSYVEFPVALSVFPAIRDSSFTHPFLRFGLSPALLAERSLEPGPDCCVGVFNPNAPAYDDTKVRPWDVGGLLGAGIEHRTSRGASFAVELRGEISLLDIGYTAHATTRNYFFALLFRFAPPETPVDSGGAAKHISLQRYP